MKLEHESNNPNAVVHTPVLLNEVIQYLNPQPGKLYVDGTVGAGGHLRAILEKTQPDGRLIGVDQDASILTLAQSNLAGFANRLEYRQMNFSGIPEYLGQQKQTVDGGVLLDLGVSSLQLDEGMRGFSFRHTAPLDMRMNADSNLTAADVVNTWPEAELVRIFSEYGEERFSKTIARMIVERRKSKPFETTTDLADAIADVYKGMKGGPKDRFRIHPATRVFQALRIAVNDELGHLERFLAQIPDYLTPGARVVIISFHSLEDRIVKRAFRNWAKNDDGSKKFELLTKKPVQAGEPEIAQNPRARSAKLRAVFCNG